MPTQLIPIGPPTVLTQNVAYALPATACLMTTSAACTVSTDGTNYVAFTSGGLVSAAFVKSALAGTVVTCKRQ